jgi:glycosyltransferase involved in cell wall biosynthesis
MDNKNFISIVVPALNEQQTIGEFVDWCKEGIIRAGVIGEILIIDSSTDKTAEIASAHGAKVIKVPKLGLGQAYIDAIPYIKGNYVIMGDCDLTYDFRDIKPFIEQLNKGYDFVMGTRIRGMIETGAMPSLHRYFGNPLTTFILNKMYGAKYSDIHCGMRAITLAALKKINLESASWEYASEMVLKAVKLKLRITEVPTKFYKDRAGRVSHHKRMGWISPWIAGWINLKAMFLYSPDFFLLKPGYLFFLIGMLLIAISLNAHIRIGPMRFGTHAILVGVILVVLGYSAIQMGILSKIIYDFDPNDSLRYKKTFTYNKGVIIAFIFILFGLLLQAEFLHRFIQNKFILYEISKTAIIGLVFILFGFQTFTFTLVFNMLIHRNIIVRKRA